MQITPNPKQKKKVLLVIFLIRSVCFFSSASDIVGSNIAETDPVRALGNSKRGNTIPQSTPYTDNASDEVKPYFSRLPGNETVSMLANRLTMIRLILIIMAIFIILTVKSPNSFRNGVVLFDSILRTDDVKSTTDKRVDAASPQRSPVAAMLNGGVRPSDVKILQRIKTLETRATCSNNWVPAEIPAFLRPRKYPFRQEWMQLNGIDRAIMRMRGAVRASDNKDAPIQSALKYTMIEQGMLKHNANKSPQRNVYTAELLWFRLSFAATYFEMAV